MSLPSAEPRLDGTTNRPQRARIAAGLASARHLVDPGATSLPSRDSLRYPLLLTTLLALGHASTSLARASFASHAAFELQPAEVLGIAASVTPDPTYPITELLEEMRVSLDEQGRQTHRYRYVFRIDRETAIQSWGVVQTSWAPWFEEKPTVRARVITASGKETYLDASTLVEFPAEGPSSDTFSDRMLLKAPLPDVGVGAMVEVETVSREHRPFSTSGASGTFWLLQRVPVREVRFELDAPADLGIQCKTVGVTPEKLRRTTKEGRTRCLVELDDAPAVQPREPFQPADEDPYPRVRYASAKSWATVAAEYHALVEAQLQGAEPEAWVREAAGSTKERDQLIALLLEQVRRRVRYVAFEFGDGSIVPRKPSETLQRGYGDCKDQAVLLVSLLRAVGIPASVALLRAGTGEDTFPDLPGLASFNHLIVHVPGTKPLWIDPTAQFFRAGELPIQGQRRLALVIGPRTAGLVKTPGMTLADNTVIETKEVRFAALGPADLVETTQGRGVAEAVLRETYATMEPKRLEDDLTRYVTQAFSAKALGPVERSEAKDPSKPFRLTLTARQVGIATTSQVDATAAMNPWNLVSRLNSTVKPDESRPSETPDAADAGATDAGVKAVARRKHDLEFDAPWATEFRWVLHVPRGFAPDALPEDRRSRFGPATLSETFRASPDGTVTVVQRFELAQLRWTPAEVEEARAALDVFGREPVPYLAFQHVGEAHLSAGRLAEALAELRPLASASTATSSDLTRLARAQLLSGLGTSARASARRATELGPQDARAFEVLGWVLQHDTIGRRFMPGWDRSGALAAYRRSVTLDPSNREATADLAILLEHDGDGERYTTGADLDEAVALYRRLVEEKKEDTTQDNLMVCLARRGRFDEALAVTREREPAPRRNGWLVALLVTTKGFDAAKLEAERTFQDLTTRRSAFATAADVLVNFRRYAEAAKLLELGATTSSQMAQVRARAELLARVRPHAEVRFDPKDPRSPALELMRAVTSRATPEQLLALMSTAQRETTSREGILETLDELKGQFLVSGLPRDVTADLGLSLAELGQEGDERRGYQIHLRGQGATPVTLFVAKQGAGYALVGVSLEDLGREALWKASHGNLVEARAWLDLALERVAPPRADDALSGHALYQLWKRGTEGSVEDIQAAAFALLDPSKAGDGFLAKVKGVTEAARAEPRRSALRRVLLYVAVGKKDWALARELSRLLLEAHPDSLSGKQARAHVLAGAGQYDEALAFLDGELAVHPSERELLFAKTSILHQAGRFAEAEAALLERARAGNASSVELNNLAWNQVLQEKVTAKTLEWVRAALQGSSAGTYAHLHTLAAALAEIGRTAEARETILKAISQGRKRVPQPSDWYVFGRVAEQLGELGDAKVCYEKALETRDDKEAPLAKDSTAALAERRLRALPSMPPGSTPAPGGRK